MAEDLKFTNDLDNIMVFGDLEANGLYEEKKEIIEGELVVAPAADKVWMCCYRIPQLGGVCYDFIADDILVKFKRSLIRHNRQHGRSNVHLLPLSRFSEFSDIVGVQVFHNLQKYDAPIMEKLLDYHLPRDKRWDTLVQSLTQFCDREYVKDSNSGPHSLESWALRIGRGLKQEHEDWLNFSVDMYRRCYTDVEIQCDVYTALQAEREADLLEWNIDWTQALHTEHMAAFWISYSEQWGFPFDKEYAESLIVQWDKHLADIEDKLLPNMPFRRGKDRCGAATNWEDYQASMLKNTSLTRIPVGWCWEEGSGNKPLPMWNPFNKDGSISANAIKYWSGAPAQPYVPEEPERFSVPSVKDSKGKVIVKAIRARKARPAREAKPAVPDAYGDDAGLTSPPLCRMDENDIAGAFTRIQWDNYNLGSNDQVIEYLTKHTSWEHTETTDKGNPRLTEDSFDSIGGDGVGEDLKDFLITKSRRTTIKNFKRDDKGWINKIRPDGRVTPINHTMGTPTARSRHANIVNVAGGGAKWGKEMRTCWTAYENGKMVGADASGLEMRALAHEMGDETCTDEIVDGDIHTVIWDLIDDFSASRGDTKPIEYALIYGASDPKLGSLATVDGCREHFASVDKLKQRGWVEHIGMWRHKQWSPKKDSLSFKEAQDTVCGAIIRMRIMEGLTPLGDCINRITKQAEKGHLVGLDGRKLEVRSSHSALNLRLQSNGAIICKTAVVWMMEELERRGMVVIGKGYQPNKFVELFTFYHDEVQFGIPNESVEEMKTFTVDISGFDLSDKAQKKEAAGLLEGVALRFTKRQRRTKNKIWSRPKLDLKKGTATVGYTVVGQIAVETFEKVGEFYKMECPITGEWDLGDNWYETH